MTRWSPLRLGLTVGVLMVWAVVFLYHVEILGTLVTVGAAPGLLLPGGTRSSWVIPLSLASPLVLIFALGPMTTRVARSAQAIGTGVPFLVSGAMLLLASWATSSALVPIEPSLAIAGSATIFTGGLLAFLCLWLSPPEHDPLPLRAFLPWRVVWRWVGFGRLHPGTLFFGPIFQKEMRVAGRKKSTYVERGGYVLLVSGFVILIYASTRSSMESTSGAYRISQLQSLAPSITMTVAILQGLLICLAAPLSMSSAINEERTSRTMASLMTTPLSSLEIVVGKLMSRGVQLSLMTLLSTPLLLAIRIYGGVQSEAIVAAIAITLSVAFMGAAAGVLASVFQKRALTATFSAIAMVVFIEFAPIMIWTLMMLGGPGAGGAPATALLVTCAPVAFMISMMQLTGIENVGGGGFPAHTIWIATSVYHVVMGIVFAGVAVFALRRLMLADASGSISTERRALERDARTVSDDPILWREVRQPLITGWKAIILTAVIAGLYVFALVQVKYDREAIFYLALVFGSLTMTLQAATLAAGGMGSEREARTLDVLLMTPLHPLRILGGKMIGAIRRQWYVPCLTLALVGVVPIVAARCHPIVLLHLPVIFLSTIIFLAGTGTWLSVQFEKTRTAATINLGLAILLWGGIPLGTVIIVEMLGAFESDGLGRVIMLTNPIALAMTSFSGAEQAGRMRNGLEFDLPAGDMDPVSFTIAVMIFGAVYAGLGIGALFHASSRFNRRMHRSP